MIYIAHLMFRSGIMVKVELEGNEKDCLPEDFDEAAQQLATATGTDYIYKERKDPST